MNWDYFAGFVDGEGYLALVRSRRLTGDRKGESWITRPTIQVYQSSDPAVLHAMRDFVGLGVVYERKVHSPNHNRAWFWKATGRALRPMLVELAPRLFIKKRQAEVMVQFIDRAIERKTRPHTAEDLALVDQVSALNNKVPGLLEGMEAARVRWSDPLADGGGIR